MYAKKVEMVNGELVITDYDDNKITLSLSWHDDVINLLAQRSPVAKMLTEVGVPESNDIMSRVARLVGMYEASVGVFDPQKKRFVVKRPTDEIDEADAMFKQHQQMKEAHRTIYGD